MIEKKEVKVQLKDGTTTKALIEVDLETPGWLNFKCSDLETREFHGDDLYGTFNRLRAWIDKVGAKLLCNGARIDVAPSGMSRSMGGGRKSYVLRLSQPSRSDDLVDIFEYAGPEKIGTMEQQQDYYKEWVSSLKG